MDPRLEEIRQRVAKMTEDAAQRHIMHDPDEIAQSMGAQIEEIFRTEAEAGRFWIKDEWVEVDGMELVGTEVLYNHEEDKLDVRATYRAPVTAMELRLRKEAKEADDKLTDYLENVEEEEGKLSDEV